MQESIFDKLDFGPLKPLLDNDDITDISYCNAGQIWIRSLTQGSLRVEIPSCTPEFMEKLAFQCSNVMGTTFNNAKPFLDAESSELRLNFVHDSIATNGIACVIRKTPAKIRLEKEKLLKEDYFTADIHDVLIKCVQGHCNIIVAGETGSGKTEFVKYLASHTKENEKIITIEDTLELHLDKIFPKRDIVAMKTNNVASYTDVLVTCMRQNPKWILLSEVRSAEAVTAVRNSISSGHNILSTIHADKASAIPYRLYSLMETDLDVDQFLTTIYRYVQLGVHIKAYYSKEYGKFHRELDEVVEFYVDEDNVPRSHTIYRKIFGKEPIMRKPSPHLMEYLENQNISISDIVDHLEEDDPLNPEEGTDGGKSVFDNSVEQVASVTDNNIITNSGQVVDSSVDNEINPSINTENVSTGIDVNKNIVESAELAPNTDNIQIASSANMNVVSNPNIDTNSNVTEGATNHLVNAPLSTGVNSIQDVNGAIDTAAVVSSAGGNMANPDMGSVSNSSLDINSNMIPGMNGSTYQVQGAITPTIDENMIHSNMFAGTVENNVMPIDNSAFLNQNTIGTFPSTVGDMSPSNIPNTMNNVVGGGSSYTADVGQPILPNIEPTMMNSPTVVPPDMPNQS